MHSDMQSALIQLIGALVLAIPLTARAVPRALEKWTAAKADARKSEADAVLKRAEADRIEAETASSALAEFRRRLDECEKRHDEQDELIRGLRRQQDLDAELLLKFSQEIDLADTVIRGLKAEIDELRRALL